MAGGASLLPTEGFAQPVRVAHARVVVAGGAYYRPYYYRPYAYRPYFYRPYYYSYYSPFWGGYWGYPYGFGPWGPYAYYGAAYYDLGAVRIQVTPKQAEVYVDGYLAGTVDDFDGFAQRLRLPPGEYEIEVSLRGHRSLRQTLRLTPGVTYRMTGALEPLAPGESPAGPPEPLERPRRQAAPEPRDHPRTYGRPGAPDDAQYGSLAIRVQPPGAVVVIDGERWEGSETDTALIVQVAEGPHRVDVQMEGHRPFSRTVDVRRGRETTLNVSLSRADR